MNSIVEQDIQAFADTFALHGGLRGKTIAVTGATGLLGTTMIRSLQALDRLRQLHLHIIAVVRSEEKFRQLFADSPANLSCHVHDFAADMPFELPEPVDYIVHLASPTASAFFARHPVETLRVGLDGTRRLLDYAMRSRVRVLYVSSLEVYGTILDDTRPVDETCQGYLDPLSARSSYPMAKRAAECMCHAYASEFGTEVSIVRVAQTFGPGIAPDDNRVFAQFARSVVAGTDIVLHTTGELCRSYCYTTDAVSAMLYVLLKGVSGEAYNVVNADTYISIIDMARLVCRHFNPDIRPVVQLQDGMGYSPVTRLRLSDEKITRLGWRPVYGLHDMFARLIAYLREETGKDA